MKRSPKQRKKRLRMIHAINERSRQEAHGTLKRSKGGFTVTIGGLVRGTQRQFKTRGGAERAVDKHYNRALDRQLTQHHLHRRQKRYWGA